MFETYFNLIVIIISLLIETYFNLWPVKICRLLVLLRGPGGCQNELAMDNNVADKGKEALESYIAKRAILIIAGSSFCIVLVTLNAPKTLIRVN